MRSTLAFLRNCMVLLALALACFEAAAQQQIVVEKDSPLYASPQTSSKVVGQVTQGMTGESLGQKGTWVNVKTEAGTGWLFTFNVRFVTQGSSPAAKAPAAVPRNKVTSTIGIRGLDVDDLRNANFDGQQLGLLDSYAVSKPDAERAARASGLSAARIDYFTQ